MKCLFLVPVLLCAAMTAHAQTDQQWSAIRADFNPDSKQSIDDIIRRIGDKRVVSIGEDTHGTGEFYDFRATLTRRLIEEKGFSVFVLENPHEDMVALQQSLGKVPMDTLMRQHLFPIYQTAQVKQFLEWAQGYSARNKKFRMAGCDDSFRDIVPRLLKQRFASWKNPLLDSLLTDYELRTSHKASEYYALIKKPMPENLSALTHLAENYKLVRRIDSIYKTQPKRDPMADELLFHAYSSFELFPAIMEKRFISRDSAMGNRINYFAMQKGAKVIVWAHNAHISKKPFVDDIGKMGETVSKANPGNYFAIALGTATGSYSYITTRNINADHNFRDSIFSKTFLPLQEGSINETLLRLTPAANVVYDFTRLKPADRPAFEERKPLRFVGYNAEKPQPPVYYDVSPAELFDLLIFFPKTSPTTPVFGN
ncbi:erythromycin esterase family protein [Chitinophaga lutea]